MREGFEETLTIVPFNNKVSEAISNWESLELLQNMRDFNSDFAFAEPNLFEIGSFLDGFCFLGVSKTWFTEFFYVKFNKELPAFGLRIPTPILNDKGDLWVFK